jgi:hypothetical protein
MAPHTLIQPLPKVGQDPLMKYQSVNLKAKLRRLGRRLASGQSYRIMSQGLNLKSFEVFP